MPEDLLLSAANALKLEDDLKPLKALAAAAKKLAELRAAAADLADLTDVVDLVNRLADEAKAPELAKAFKAVGLEAEFTSLTAYLKKLAAGIGKIPDDALHLGTLLSKLPVGDPKGKVAWRLQTPDKPEIKTDRYFVDLSARAEIDFDAGAQWPNDPASPKLLSLAVSADLKADANTTLPFAHGPLKAGAGASAHADLAYYFRPATDQIYAVAVAERVTKLPDPFDFDSMWDSFEGSDLEGVVYGFGGAAHANIDVALADANIFGPQLAADLGLTVKVSASLKADYDLALRRTSPAGAPPIVSATLSRNRVKESEFSLAFDLKVDLTTLTQPVLKALTRAVGKWDDLLAEIKPYLSPGTFIRAELAKALSDELETLIGDADLRAAVLSDAKGALGLGDPSNPAIVAWMLGKVKGAVDHGSVLIDGRIGEAVDRVMAPLAEALPVLAKKDVGGKLKAAVSKQVQAIDAKLQDEVKKVIQKPGQGLGKALADAGATVSGVVAAFDDALKGVRNLLGKYDHALHEVLTKAEAAAKAKATLRLYAREKTTSGDVVEVSGEFSARTDGSRGAFRALSRGTMDALAQLVGGDDPPGFKLARDASFIRRYSKFEREQGLEVSFLGIDMTMVQWVKAGAEVILDGNHNISVTSNAEARKLLSLFSDREVSFVESEAVALAGATARDPSQGRPVVEIGIGAVYSEKTLELDDLDEFIGSLEGASLVSGTARGEAAAKFAVWAAEGKFKGSVAANLRLDGPRIKTLLAREDDGTFPEAARINVVDTAIDALKDLGAVKKAGFDRGVGLAASLFKLAPVPKTVAGVFLGYRKAIFPLHLPGKDGTLAKMPFGSADEPAYLAFLAQAAALEAIVDLVARMGAIYLARPKADGAGDPNGWTVEDYRNAQKAIAQDSQAWMTVAKDVVGLFHADITPRTLAFMRTMSNLAGPGADGKLAGVTVSLTRTPATGEPETVTFQ